MEYDGQEALSRGPESVAGENSVTIGASNRVRYLSLESGSSRSERRAVQLVRIVRRILPTFLIMLGDYVALIVSGEIAIVLRHVADPIHFDAQFTPALLVYSALMLLSYAVVGLYAPIVSSGGPEELRRLSLATTMLAVIMAIVTYVSREHFDVSVSMYIIAWGLALFAAPLMRAVVRKIFSRFRWWSRKAIILGMDVRSACHIAKAIQHDPHLGLRPVAILSADPDSKASAEFGLPQLSGLGSALENQREQGVDCAIVTLSLLANDEAPALIRRYETYFRHWLLVPYFPHGYSLWVTTCDLNGTLALELTHRLLRKSDQIIKRIMDLTLTLIGGIIALPLSLLIALVIRLDSPGPALYNQKRIGKEGKEFPAFKFRSMVQNADEILEHYLENHPEFRKEWAETQKLKEDPRVTRIGKFLRKTSLDELPQLLNVIRGEMSLVGPRPIVADEVPRYEGVWDLYKRVHPGITGQWQISGRNDTSYKERTSMDAYYVRNWSVWLDIYILARTVKVVLFRDGAY